MIWLHHHQKVMYLLVGVWNSFVAYACFAILYVLLNAVVIPSGIVALAYVVSSVNGYLSFRHLVFTPVRHPIVEYARYQAVYLPILAVNMIALPLALTYTNLSAYVIQAMLAVFAIVAAYIGNKYFAFRRPTV